MEDKEPKPYSKFRARDEDSGINISFNFKNIAPYLMVTLSFIIALLIILLMFDKLVMPFMIYDKESVNVPEVTELSLEDGAAKIESVGLLYKVTSQLFSEKYPENTILSQTPSGRSNIKQGRTIYLTISKGNQKVAVPMLVGFPLRIARIELIKRGLTLGSVAYDNSELFGNDTIVYQNSSAGQSVNYGKSVDVVVSNGSSFNKTVPSLIGAKYEDVEFILQSNGFILGNVSYRHSETFTPNTVLEQSPNQGELLPENTLVNIIISK